MRWSIFVVGCVASCAQSGLEEHLEPSELDRNFFRCQVQPVLASSCAFMDCHGNESRPFSTYAEQRFRLGIDWEDFELPLTVEELEANFRMASGFVAPKSSQADLLYAKPLDTRAGGLFHLGRTRYGDEDVFVSEEDLRYRVLREFASGATEVADCVPREDLGL